MCRNIRTLFNFEPPATDDEIRAASLQFVRKLSGFNAPSKANQAVFTRSVEEVFDVGAWRVTNRLVTLFGTKRNIAARLMQLLPGPFMWPRSRLTCSPGRLAWMTSSRCRRLER